MMKAHRNCWTVLRRWRPTLAVQRLGDSGAAMVEFTLVAPFLIALALGMSEFGRFLYQYELVLEGLRDGARYLARTQDPTTTANKNAAKNLAVYGNTGGTGSPRVDGWATADVTYSITNVNNSGGLYRGDPTIEVVVGSTTFNYADVGFLAALGLPSLSVGVSHQQRAIRD